MYGDLSGAAAKGYGKEFYNYDRNGERKLKLQQNVFRFSAAKTYQEQAFLNYLLKDETGNRRSFADFKKEALKLDIEYNQNYLKTELQTFQRASAMAEKWGKYEEQKGLYPNLQYKTAKDDRVREDHAELLDIIKPIGDRFWDKWYPPNGWNCRCYVVQTDKQAISGTPEGDPTLGFHNNPGKTSQPVDTEHPYYIFPKKEVGKIRTSFEGLKENLPMYSEVHKKGKGSLELSVWADPADIFINMQAGKVLVDKLAAKVKIRPHIDATIKKGYKNPEFEINGIVGDLKGISSNMGIKNGFTSAKKQMGNLESYTVVFSLDKIKSIDLSTIIIELRNRISPNRGKKIKSVFFTYKAKAIELKRDDIIAGKFEKLIELVK
ncbi:MAG: phage minor head protein [Leeuwenhoekiella sp.]